MNEVVKRRIEQIKRGEVPTGYKKTKAGIVPGDWEETCLGDIYTERKEPGNESLPLLMVSIHTGVSDGEVDEGDLPKKVRRIEDKSQYKRAVSGDLVFNMMRAWQGAIGTVRTEGMVSPAYVVAMPNNMVVPLFIDYYIRTPRMIGTINRKSYGVTDFRKRLYWDSFAPIQCALPTINEQKKIAEILAAQDKIIVLKEKLLEEKKKQKKYLMQQLLTGKKRLPGFTGEWQQKALSKILVEGSKEPVDTNNYKKITIKLNFNGIEFANINREMADTRPFYLRKKNEIIIGKQNYFNGSIALVTDEFDNCICSNAIMSFSVKGENTLFVLSFISQSDYMRKYEMLANGTGQKELSEKDFLNFEIKLPSIDEQNKIAEVLSNADKEITTIQKSIDQEKQKKKALMQLLLTGIVRTK